MLLCNCHYLWAAHKSFNAAGDLVTPAVLAECLRVGRVNELDVWVLEFTEALESPVNCNRGHDSLDHWVGHCVLSNDPIEPDLVPHVMLGERDPLGIHYDHAGPLVEL